MLFSRSGGHYAPPVAQPRLRPHQHGNAQRLRGEDPMQRVHGSVAVNPQRIEGWFAAMSAQLADDAIVHGHCEARILSVTQTRHTDMVISIQQRNVPFHADAETLVLVPAHGKIRTVQHGQIDVRLLGNAPQQGSLVLDGVAHQVGQPHPPSRARV